jgi:sigma-B regulation protein RsbU (phosphoserine phosphatase)
VYHLPSRRLRWAGGGHPPALLTGAAGQLHRQLLDSDGPLIGAVEGLEFTASETQVPAGGRLFLFSDGAFEVVRPDGSMWAFDDFLATLTAPQHASISRLDGLIATIRGLSGRDDFNDDFSMLELSFA